MLPEPCVSTLRNARGFGCETALIAVDDTAIGWGVGLHDFDNDGDLDIFIANGSPSEGGSGEQTNDFFLNDGTGQYSRAEPDAGSGLEALHNSRVAVFSDVDRDGDIDVLVSNEGSAPTLLRNDMATGRWLQVHLRHPHLSPVVGARIVVTAGTKTFRRWVKGTPSFGGSSTRWVHVGLGNAPSIDSVTVHWPDGTEQVVNSPDLDTFIEIAKTTATQPAPELTPPSVPGCATLCARLDECGALQDFGVADTTECAADCTDEPLPAYTAACFAGVACEVLERCETFDGE
jgi:hypothetical protein